ncbi:Uncharacterised protein [Vibrio cholerae]|nr:Uncharacterised protein [Vibrio cholerae]CSI81527.1 Uncharacterised protein [Vibrio cholerae]
MPQGSWFFLKLRYSFHFRQPVERGLGHLVSSFLTHYVATIANLYTYKPINFA